MRIIAAALLLSISATAAVSESLVATESRFSVKESLDRLTQALDKAGIKPAARVDHSAGARAVGMDLPPTEVLMFGNPKLGTPLMQSNPAIGIDLPMKVLAWQDKDGKVWIGYTPPAALAERHGITDRNDVVTAMTAALAGLTKAAAGP